MRGEMFIRGICMNNLNNSLALFIKNYFCDLNLNKVCDGDITI